MHSALLLFGLLPMPMMATPPLEEIHLLLSSGCRIMLTIAATLFLAYAMFMTTLVTTSAIRGGVSMLQSRQVREVRRNRGISQDQLSLAGIAGRS